MNAGEIWLVDEAATVALGRLLAGILEGHGLVTLQGNLGGGKTTLCRGLIQAMGHTGKVKSPTYTLVEPYELPQGKVLHYDLYRLADPGDIEFLGMRDFLDGDTLTLVEWPERAGEHLPPAELALSLSVHEGGRLLSWRAMGPRAEQLGTALRKAFPPPAKS